MAPEWWGTIRKARLTLEKRVEELVTTNNIGRLAEKAKKAAQDWLMNSLEARLAIKSQEATMLDLSLRARSADVVDN